MSIAVKRGYNFQITATEIKLDSGGTIATWIGGGITTLLSTLNDGGQHFLVVDFGNTSGTTWRLKTSVDGAAFVDQNTATGPAVAVADTDPAITMSGVASDAFVDEVAMWTGHTEFTTSELDQLYSLANTHGVGLDQYTSQFTAMSIASDPSATAITVSPNDNGGSGDGTTPFARNYPSSTEVTLTAPATSGNRVFAGWRNSGGDTLSLSKSFVLTVSAAETVTAHYESIGDSRDDHSVASP